jgi:hypothetical protein
LLSIVPVPMLGAYDCIDGIGRDDEGVAEPGVGARLIRDAAQLILEAAFATRFLCLAAAASASLVLDISSFSASFHLVLCSIW